MVDIKQLVNATSAARICVMSRRHFYAYLEKDAGPEAVVIDGQRFYDRASVLAWNRVRRKRPSKTLEEQA